MTHSQRRIHPWHGLTRPGGAPDDHARRQIRPVRREGVAESGGTLGTMLHLLPLVGQQMHSCAQSAPLTRPRRRGMILYNGTSWFCAILSPSLLGFAVTKTMK